MGLSGLWERPLLALSCRWLVIVMAAIHPITDVIFAKRTSSFRDFAKAC